MGEQLRHSTGICEDGSGLGGHRPIDDELHPVVRRFHQIGGIRGIVIGHFLVPIEPAGHGQEVFERHATLARIEVLHPRLVEIMQHGRGQRSVEIAACDGDADQDGGDGLRHRLHAVLIGAVVVGMPGGIEVVVGTGEPSVQGALAVRLLEIETRVIVRVFSIEDHLPATHDEQAIDQLQLARIEVMVERCDRRGIDSERVGGHRFCRRGPDDEPRRDGRHRPREHGATQWGALRKVFQDDPISNN